MSREERLDDLVATLATARGHLDDLARARVAARLVAAIAAPPVPPRRSRAVPLVAAVAAVAAAAVAIVLVARSGGPPLVLRAVAPGAVARSATTPPAPAEAAPPVPPAGTVVAAGESRRFAHGGAGVTLVGPGRLAPVPGGLAVSGGTLLVENDGGATIKVVVDVAVRTEVVAWRASFALDASRDPQVTVTHGDLVMHCPGRTLFLGVGERRRCTDPTTRAPRRPAPTSPSSVAPVVPPVAPPPDVVSPSQVAPPPAAPLPAVVPPVPVAPPASPPTARELYRAAEGAMRRGERDVARASLLEILDRFPHEMASAPALLDLARLAYRAGEHRAALAYLDRLAAHPHRSALAEPAARLRRRIEGTARRR